MARTCETSDLIVFSHLRWDYMLQRPQHLLSWHTKYRRVFYVESPKYGVTELPRLHLRESTEGVLIVVPHLPTSIDPEKINTALSDLMDELIYEEELIDYSALYYTPEALDFSRELAPRKIIYDCMDDFSRSENFKHIKELENELLGDADLVLTSGASLFHSHKTRSKNIHQLLNGVDYRHFSQARQRLVEPDDQINIPHPRIGFYGAIDERVNLELIMQLADLRPDYHFVLVGPVSAKAEGLLPKRLNLHYLGMKDYYTLPLYLAGWDCTMVPFNLNEFTENSSPAMIPEFLAAGKPVVSTPVTNVISAYERNNLVHISDVPENFIDAVDMAMEEKKLPEWIDRIDHYLSEVTWEKTFKRMAELESSLMHDNALIEQILHPQTINSNGVVQ